MMTPQTPPVDSSSKHLILGCVFLGMLVFGVLVAMLLARPVGQTVPAATPSSSPSNEPESSVAPSPSVDPDPTLSDLIVVNSPTANAVISSPLKISGKARGTWFFEASFPVKLFDADGTVLAEGTAKATGDWMTSAFVPFTAELKFTKPSSEGASGMLMLAKDNPSGLPENDKNIGIPVVFK